MEETTENEHDKVLKRWDICEKDERENRELAVKDRLFLAAPGGMYDNNNETRQDKPRFQIDRISPAKDQIIGNQLQEVIGPSISPGVGGDEKTAEIYEGLIRRIENESDSDNIYDNAFDETITGGYGGWRILTKKNEDNPFDDTQTPYLKKIDSADTSLYFGPEAENYDKSDASDAFLISYMVRETFEKEYPNASIIDFDHPTYQASSWFDGDKIRVAEYWYKKPIKIRYGKMSDGSVLNLDEEEDALNELALMGVTIVDEVTVDGHKVCWRLLNGAEFLTEEQVWAGKYIPLIPEFGKTAVVDGKSFVWGLVRKARDPQEVYNYSTSSAIETTALTPKDPYFATPTQVGPYKAQWEQIGVKNMPVLLYNSDPAAPGPPQRGGAPQLQQALLQQKTQAAEDIFATTGMYPPAMGNGPELKSGKAINAETEKGDRGSYVYQMNLKRSIQYTYTQLIDLIPKVMDTERIEKIQNQDGTTEDIELNKTIIDQETLKPVIVNDLSKGKYIARAKSGASFMTKKAETVEQLKELANGSEVIQSLGMDIVVKNMELNEGDELHKRLRKDMINKGVVEPTDEEKKELGLDKPRPPDPMQESLVKNLNAQTDKLMIEQEKIIAEIKNKDADTENKIMQSQKATVDAFKTMTDALIAKLQAGVPISQNDAELAAGQEAVVMEVQEDVLEGQEVAGSLPMNAKGVQVPPGQQTPQRMQEPRPPQNTGVKIPEGFEGT